MTHPTYERPGLAPADFYPVTMLVISLTSIPPRFDALPRVLHSLLLQNADRVVLTLPRDFQRFPGPVSPPPLPAGVDLLWTDRDLGPATKIIPARAALPRADIVYCDDDCLYEPGWLDALCQADAPVASASIFDGGRLGLPGLTIAQGFAGVRLAADVAIRAAPPEALRYADDLFLSALWTSNGFKIEQAAKARAFVRPLHAPEGLQDKDRKSVYAQAANWLRRNPIPGVNAP